eukprot:TRINITY_DN1724_c0_g1_i1.p1 TRINITY_DN1724_c0_g1~~TRINITY_DN1724_c0_g1_i1.p1  ORF type:complete len:147 (+),score=42.17 TRINITY_DN1724_c0_g1_i1:267-707(+)
MSRQGVTVKDVEAAAFIKEYAMHLKRTQWLQIPTWSIYVKTGISRELAPIDDDWFFVRAASIARKIYIRGGTGIGALRKVYGNKKRDGPSRSHFTLASGGLLRYIVQEFERLGILEADEKKGGRRISAEGQKDLDRIAGRVAAQLA